jgi:spore coat polysaccharide biosynthesis protein SpsF
VRSKDNAVILQVRSDSKRLKNKFLKKIGKESILKYLIRKIKKIKNKNYVIIATPKGDKKVTSHLKNIKGIYIFEGSKNNVLDRYYKCSKKFKIDTIIRLTGDNPFVDVKLISKYIKIHNQKNKLLTSNTINDACPNGIEFEIFDKSILKKAWKMAKLNSEKSHVTPYMYKMLKRKIIKRKESLKIDDYSKFSFLRFTLDHDIDYDVIKNIYKFLHKKNVYFGCDQIIKLYKDRPDVFSKNKNLIRDEDYKLSLESDHADVCS